MGTLKPLSPERQTSRRRLPAPLATSAAVAIFALLAVAAPLAFGAVDRIAQVGLVALLAVGVFLVPPVVAPLGKWGNRLVIALVVVLVLKEFAPAVCFGSTSWRTELTRNFRLEFPGTHHPEPARALDALLAGLVAIVWFLWVRTLAIEREQQQTLVWCLFVGAAIVAAVSFATRGLDPRAIYGLRFTPGWTGFGPFPNRNHSADFFAMGGVVGFGCATWAAARKKWVQFAMGLVMIGVLIAGVLDTESRGGLVAFVAGVAIYLTLLFFKLRSRKVLVLGGAAILVIGVLTLVFGSKVISRFGSEEKGRVSTAMRVAVWRDTVGMWKDAPLFGHGLDSFPQVFPMYQHLDLEETVVLHPESSWLQWLAELGLIPVLLGTVAAVRFVSPHLREIFVRRQSFYLRAGAFAAVAVLVIHAAFDVPAHRWGTAGYALAVLAVACPMHFGRSVWRSSRGPAAVLLAVAVFWACPFVLDRPAWSPLSLERLLSRDAVGGDVRTAEFEQALRYFPLNPWLHQGLGVRQAHVIGRLHPSVWQQHFALASRLVPGSWTVPATQARVCQPIAPGLAIGYWQQAIERGGLHRDEVFGTSVSETAKWPMSAAVWGRYVEANPKLLPAYAMLVPNEQAAYYYALWWKERGLTAALEEHEIEDFYKNVTHWGSRAQFDEWMMRRADREPHDYRQWAALLHKWGDEERAWELLARHIPEPDFPPGIVTVSRPQLEATWRLAPANFVNAQQLAQVVHGAGETVQSDAIIVAVAAQDNPPAPPWFAHKAAYIYARGGRYGEAVAVLLARK